jgi:hypothetical protein
VKTFEKDSDEAAFVVNQIRAWLDGRAARKVIHSPLGN